MTSKAPIVVDSDDEFEDMPESDDEESDAESAAMEADEATPAAAPPPPEVELTHAEMKAKVSTKQLQLLIAASAGAVR
jgi:hypothetical protein